jgi:hypothetical protein
MSWSKPRSKGNETVEQAARGEVQFSTPEVPEYPVLASGVELIGEMEETGFAQQQWLIRRGDRFVQLSGLLYRVAEQADGKSTHEEMAEGATRSTEWSVSAENVRELLRGKLLPLGVVASAEGDALWDVRAGDLNISPLRVKGRTRLLGPDAIDGITMCSRFSLRRSSS